MPDFNALILTGADFKAFLKVNGGGVYPLKTMESIDMTVAAENELIYAVGEEDPIGNKNNARSRKGKLTLQVGEASDILGLEGIPDFTYIVGATLGITAIQGGYQETWKQVNFHTDSRAVKGKEKQSLCTLDFSAISSAL